MSLRLGQIGGLGLRHQESGRAIAGASVAGLSGWTGGRTVPPKRCRKRSSAESRGRRAVQLIAPLPYAPAGEIDRRVQQVRRNGEVTVEEIVEDVRLNISRRGVRERHLRIAVPPTTQW